MKRPSPDPYDPALRDVIDAAVSRLSDRLRRSMPLAGGSVRTWMNELAGGDDPAAYFHHVRGSPMFIFPWVLERLLQGVPDLELQFDLVYSTISGYYWIRLIDNITDHQSTNEMELLPSVGFFQAEFQRPYQSRFPASHPFWEFFARTWFHSADVTMKDLQTPKMDRDGFVQVAAHKICAIKIPLAALCHTYSRLDALSPWCRFVDLFGCWHQMSNDLFHWYEDFSVKTHTFFLAEAGRQKRPSETVPEWVTREGFAWGLSALDVWMRDLQLLAKELRSRDLLEYLKLRERIHRRDADEMLVSLQLASRVKGILF